MARERDKKYIGAVPGMAISPSGERIPPPAMPTPSLPMTATPEEALSFRRTDVSKAYDTPSEKLAVTRGAINSPREALPPGPTGIPEGFNFMTDEMGRAKITNVAKSPISDEENAAIVRQNLAEAEANRPALVASGQGRSVLTGGGNLRAGLPAYEKLTTPPPTAALPQFDTSKGFLSGVTKYMMNLIPMAVEMGRRKAEYTRGINAQKLAQEQRRTDIYGQQVAGQLQGIPSEIEQRKAQTERLQAEAKSYKMNTPEAQQALETDKALSTNLAKNYELAMTYIQNSNDPKIKNLSPLEYLAQEGLLPRGLEQKIGSLADIKKIVEREKAK